MAIEQTEMQALPFVVEPIASHRVKLWARLASQVMTEGGFRLVSYVYRSFFYEDAALQTYQHALIFVDAAAAGDMREVSSFVFWLDHLAYWLGELIEVGTEIQESLLPLVGELASSRYEQDIRQRVTSAVRLLAEVRQFGVAVCQEFGLVIPRNFIDQSTSPTVPAAGEGAESL